MCKQIEPTIFRWEELLHRLVQSRPQFMQALVQPRYEDLLSGQLGDVSLLAILPELPAATLARLRRTCRCMRELLDWVPSLQAWSSAARPLLRRLQHPPTRECLELCNSRHQPPLNEAQDDGQKACPQGIQQLLRDQTRLLLRLKRGARAGAVTHHWPASAKAWSSDRWYTSWRARAWPIRQGTMWSPDSRWMAVWIPNSNFPASEVLLCDTGSAQGASSFQWAVRPTLGWKIGQVQWLTHRPHHGTSQWLVYMTHHQKGNLARWGLSCHDVVSNARREVLDEQGHESAAFIEDRILTSRWLLGMWQLGSEQTGQLPCMTSQVSAYGQSSHLACLGPGH